MRSNMDAETEYIIIKGDSDIKSDNSSDIDYDELLVHGTVIVIKDDEKKKKYLKKLKDRN